MRNNRYDDDGDRLNPEDVVDAVMSKVKRYSYWLGGTAVVLFGLYAVGQTFQWVDAGEIIVLQSAVDGSLSVVSEPGPMCACWGTVTTYPRRLQVVFHRPTPDEAKEGLTDTSIRVRYNDGGYAWVSGQISWEMPTAADAVIELHRDFRSAEAIQRQLISPAIVDMLTIRTAPLMSSTESYAARRTEFVEAFADQLRNGPYQTRTIQVREPDPITGEEKTIAKVDIVMGPGGPTRIGPSPFQRYSIGLPIATLTGIDYDDEVERQIAAQRDAVLAVQTAQASTKQAEQAAITAKAQGEAKAATARADAMAAASKAVVEAERARDVAILEAQQNRDVAKLGQEAASFYKQEQILRGEGDAAARRLVMEADGALERKLAAWADVQKAYAAALGAYQGPLVPSVVMGSGNGTGGGMGMQQMLEMLAVKSAKDLALDMSITNSKAGR